MARWKWLGLSALVVLAGAVAVPFLVPVSSFIPEISRIASEKLGHPVRMEDLRLHILPTPRVVASGIEVGRAGDARIGELEIVPDVVSFLTGPRTIRLIQVRDVALRTLAFPLPAATKDSGKGGEPLHVRRLVALNVKVGHPTIHIPAFDAEVLLGDGFAVEQARLETRDKALSVSLVPAPKGAAKLSIAAKAWTLPAGAPLVFDALAAEGSFRGSRVDLPRIEAALYGGTVKGAATIDWSRQWQLGGKAEVAGVDLVPLQEALGKAPNLSGRVQAAVTFSARGKSPGDLAGALVVEGPFEVHGGAYQGVDLSKAGDITGKPADGDATSFEELKGRLQLRARRVRIDELCVRSPKMAAGGYVEVDPDRKLAGKLDVSVARTGGFVGVPVTLGGTTTDPSVRPSTGYLVGAALGTVLLPGIGTTLGASAGSKLEGTSSSCK
jgi:hypothetical protein